LQGKLKSESPRRIYRNTKRYIKANAVAILIKTIKFCKNILRIYFINHKIKYKGFLDFFRDREFWDLKPLKKSKNRKSMGISW
jgi:hypothetical protein